MKLQQIVAILATAQAVSSTVVPEVKKTYRGGILPRQVSYEEEEEPSAEPQMPSRAPQAMAGMNMDAGAAMRRMPAWNFVRQTTADATADGKRGVLLEPDLIPGTRGIDGGRIKKIRIGPYTIEPAANRVVTVPQFEAPCYDCYITAMQLGLEYPDGRVANVDSGAWCHHIDLTVPGTDYTCPSSFLRTITTQADPAMGGRRIFSTGNDRVPMRLNSKYKYGLDLGESRFGGVMEFMNENKRSIEVYMTLTFEYVPKSTPGYKEAQMVWVDVTNCGRQSDFPSPEGTYERKSHKFAITEDSYWLNAIGHQHDGGTHVELYVNDQLSCVSKQLYGNRRGGWQEPNDGTIQEEMLMPAYSHVSDVGVCKDWGELNAGDQVHVVAYYNDTMHPQMRDASGQLEPQMGIMFTWIGPKSGYTAGDDDIEGQLASIPGSGPRPPPATLVEDS